MNDEIIQDLKQFIDARISQSDARLDKLDGKIDKLRQEMLDGFTGVGDAIEIVHVQLEDFKLEFDRRLTKLEQQSV